MEVVRVAGITEVLIGEDLPSPLLPPRESRRKAAVVTQPGATTHALEVADAIRHQDLEVDVIGVPDREQAKTLEVASAVYTALTRFGLARGDTVVGVGGGAVTDLAGFVAGTWMRGVEAVHVPTTLLGAVDASIGGKTGVNVGGKNLVGVFWHPSRVVIGLSRLSLLPVDLLREGMSEALKAGLIGDPALFQTLAQHGLTAPLEEVVVRAVRVKASIVDADQREEGRRTVLNLGHTIGHAIEYASSLSHGEAVALGIVAETEVARRRTGFGDRDAVADALIRLGLPTRATGIDRARVLDLIRLDKKRDHSGMRMVLLRSIGEADVDVVGPEDIDAGLAAIGI